MSNTLSFDIGEKQVRTVIQVSSELGYGGFPINRPGIIAVFSPKLVLINLLTFA